MSPYSTDTTIDRRTKQDQPRRTRGLGKATAVHGVGCSAWAKGASGIPPPSPGDKRRWVPGEALRSRSDSADGIPWCSWLSGAIHIANSRDLEMAVPCLRWIEAHGLYGFGLCSMRATDLSLFLLSLPLKPNETRSAAPGKKAWEGDGDPRRRLQRMVGPRRLKYRSAEPAARWVSGEALRTHSDAAGGTLCAGRVQPATSPTGRAWPWPFPLGV